MPGLPQKPGRTRSDYFIGRPSADVITVDDDLRHNFSLNMKPNGRG